MLSKAGLWYDKFGARWVAYFATLVLSISLLLSSQSVTISEFIQSSLGFNNKTIPFLTMVILFFMIRFSGQGVLTMVSRNMIMKWFDAYRGRVNAFSSIIVSLGFSASPLWISLLIDHKGWQNAWLFMALGLVLFSIVILQFFRDKPEDHGLIPDGIQIQKQDKSLTLKTIQFSVKEALATRAFWMYSLVLAFYSFFVTGITFHIVSLFEQSGYTKDKAIAIFLPTSLISVIVSAVANYLSDWLKLQLYLYLMIVGGVISSFGLIFLSSPAGIPLLITGMGILGGFFAVLNAITWPRFYGRKNLGGITGKTMGLIVFASALAPSMFSFSISYFSWYGYIGIISLVFLSVISLASIKASNPQ
jgi:MFS family permease